MKHCLLLAVLLFFSLIDLHAQTIRNLSVDELFEIGIENSVKIQSSRLHVEVAKEKEASAKTGLLPDISIGLIGGYVGQPTVFTSGLSGATHPDVPDWLQNYTVEMTQPLYAGGKIRRTIEKSSLEKQIALLNLDKDKADIKLLLMAKYLELFCLYKQQDVFTQNIQDAERRLHDINQMKAEGMLTNNDVLRSELQLTNYKLALRETSDNIAIVSQWLDIALGLDESLLLMPDTAVLENPPAIFSYDHYVMQAYDLYPELKIARTESDWAEKNVRIVEGDNLPSLSVRLGNTLQRPLPNASPAQDMYMNAWNVSLVLSYKLSSLYRNKHTIDAAKRTVEMYRIGEEKQIQDIRINVKTALIKHRESLERITALTSSVEQANENYRIVRNRYFNQLAILTDLLDASSVRLDAELQLTAAKANAIYTYYQLLRSSGNL